MAGQGQPHVGIQVVLALRSPIVAAGVRTLLSRTPDIDIVPGGFGQLDGRGKRGDLGGLDRLGRDTVAVTTTADWADGVREMSETSGGEMLARTVMVVAGDQMGPLVDAVRAGIRGLVVQDGPADELIRAIRAVHSGSGWVAQPLVCALLDGLAAGPLPVEPALDVLTAREREVVAAVGRGLSNQEIAQFLTVGTRTVKFHVSNILAKLGLASRGQLIALVARSGDFSRAGLWASGDPGPRYGARRSDRS